jgi:hypothetical protein
MPSITAIAYVRAAGPDVIGTFAIWDLDAPNPTNNHLDFTAVAGAWTQLVVVMGLPNTANRAVRIEFYNASIDKYLLVDSVAAF